MKHVLITGVSGFVGRYLTEYLLSKNYRVSGIDINVSGFTKIPCDLRLFEIDIRDVQILKSILADIKPEIIYHAAGIIRSSDIEIFRQVNVLGTEALFEAVVAAGIRPVILVSSSSAVYGGGAGSRPLKEGHRFRPVTPYAVSKVAQEDVAQSYCKVHNLSVIITRTFNLIGPGMSPLFACSAYARQIARAECEGKGSTIVVGNLASRRDFIDIRDAVRAYELLSVHGKRGIVYNVCSSKSVTIGACLDYLLKMTSLRFETIVDLSLLHKNDVAEQVGDGMRLFRCTGWTPSITLQESLVDLLEYWRHVDGVRNTRDELENLICPMYLRQEGDSV